MIFEGLSEIAAAPRTAGMTDGCHGNLFRDMIADIGQASFLIDGYANFGWEIDENVMPDMTERYSANKGMHQHKKVVIRMKRALRRSEIWRKRRHPVRLYLR